MGKDVIVACDFSSAEQTFAFLDQFTGRKPFDTDNPVSIAVMHMQNVAVLIVKNQ